MHILFLSHYFVPENNAPAARVHGMAREWARLGHRVTVLTGAPNVPAGVVYEGYRNRLYQEDFIIPYLGIKYALGELKKADVADVQARVRTSRRSVRYYDQVFWDE